MKKLTTKELTNIRNIIIAVTMIGGLIIWFFLPGFVKNGSLIHVGNGTYGSKIGLLLALLLPLFALIPNTQKEEIHTEDPVERKTVLEKQSAKERKIQIAVAVIEFFVIVLIYVLWFTHAA